MGHAADFAAFLEAIPLADIRPTGNNRLGFDALDSRF